MEKKEKVTGVIQDLRTGFLGRNSYNLVVTDRRLIFAKYSTKLIKEESDKERTQNSGFFGKLKATIASGFSFHERYYGMDPKEILQEDEDNYEILPEDIKSILVKGNGTNSDYGKRKMNDMEVKWRGGKNKFKFDKLSPNQVKEILNPMLGSKLN